MDLKEKAIRGLKRHSLCQFGTALAYFSETWSLYEEPQIDKENQEENSFRSFFISFDQYGDRLRESCVHCRVRDRVRACSRKISDSIKSRYFISDG